MLYRYPTVALVFTVVLLCAVTAVAQSGRRQPKPPPAAPVPTPTPEPTPVPKKDDDKEPDLFVLVGADRGGSFSIPITLYDAVVLGCSERLKKASAAVVDVARTDLSRGEAIKKAKDDLSYVVLLSLSYDSMARSQDDIVVDFVVFMPETAKVLMTGRSYVNTNRAGPVVVNRPARLPGGLYREELYRQAGEEAADRILKKMNLVVPK